jgi:hypothetical protein
MRMDCSNLERIVHSIDLVRSCDVVRSGALRLSTPFCYPNGDHVDLFLDSQHELLDSYKLSDYGQTSQYLRSALVSANSTSRKKEIIEDITSQMGVRFAGDLYLHLAKEEIGDLSAAIMRLSQACVRISDLATHQRLRSSNSFRDDVEDFFDAHNLMYKPDVKVRGGYGKDVRVDFEVFGKNVTSYVNVLAALNESAAHASGNEIFVKWYDLMAAGITSHKFVTIYDSQSTAVSDTDVQRLRASSNVISYPEEEDFLARILEGEVLV